MKLNLNISISLFQEDCKKISLIYRPMYIGRSVQEKALKAHTQAKIIKKIGDFILAS